MHGARHGKDAFCMLQIIFKAVDRELAGDAVPGTAGACAVRIAALDHKAFDDAVKDQAVIEPFLNQENKVVYGNRCDLRIEFCLDYTAVCHGKSYDWILCHL